VNIPTIPDKHKSRKLWFALLGALLPIAASVFSADVPPDKALELAALCIVSYILGQGFVDGKAAEG